MNEILGRQARSRPSPENTPARGVILLLRSAIRGHLLPALLAVLFHPPVTHALDQSTAKPPGGGQRPHAADSNVELQSYAAFLSALGSENDMQAAFTVPGSVFEGLGACSTPFSAEFPVLGVQNTAVILIDVVGDGAQQTPEDIQFGMFESEHSIAAFIDEVSYGKAGLAGDVFGWFSLPAPDGCFISPEYDVFALIADEADLSSYERFVFVVHGMDASCSAGTSTLGKLWFSTPQGPVCASRAVVRVPFYLPKDFSQTTQSTVAHELLHGFGVPFHANAYLCDNAPVEEAPDHCSNGAYGDLFDIMGLRSQASHPNAILKEQLGWLDSSRIHTWSPEQAVTQVTVLPLEYGGPGVRAIRIPLDQPIRMATASGSNDRFLDTLYLEYRDMTGFDYRSSFFRTISTPDGPIELSDTDGLLIRGADCRTYDYCLSYLLDMHASSLNPDYPPDEVADGGLYRDEEFIELMNGIVIQVVTVAPAQSITVALRYRASVDCDDCIPRTPMAPHTAPYPHDRRKNRYISFDPNKTENDANSIAFRVEVKQLTMGSCSGNGGFCGEGRGPDDCNTCSIDGNPCTNLAVDCAPSPPQTCDPTGQTCINDAPDAGGTNVGHVWWVGPESPLLNGVHLLVSESFREVSGDWPNPVHVGDCEVVPQAVYGVRSVNVDSGGVSDELEVETTLFAPISSSYWGDCVGLLKRFCNGDVREFECMSIGDCKVDQTCDLAWTLPDGSVNFDDINAGLALFAPGATSVAPDITWVDLHGNATGTPGSQNFDPPNGTVNLPDIGQIISGFSGFPYKGYDPADCPDSGTWP